MFIRPISYILSPQKEIYSEVAFRFSIDDEAGWEFITIQQSDCDHGLRINPDEVDDFIVILARLKKEIEKHDNV